ncbi:MAG: ABC transporter permease [Candidatus Micrarchaeia archaeon]
MSRYYSVFKINFKNMLAYRWGFLLDVTLSMVTELVYIFVWIAVYAFSNISALHGITLTSMIVYFFVVGSISFMDWPAMAEVVEEDLRGGGIAKYLIRPVRYIYAAFVSVIPETLIYILFGSVPVLILVYILASLHTGAVTIIAFAFEVVLAFLVINLIGIILGSLSIYITDIFGITQGIYALFMLIGGGAIPISLFPSSIYKIIMLTPFPYLYFVPAATFTGMLLPSELPRILAVGIAWVAILALLSGLSWKKASRDINSVGV